MTITGRFDNVFGSVVARCSFCFSVSGIRRLGLGELLSGVSGNRSSFSRGYLNNYDIGTFEGGFVTFMSIVKLISSNYHFFILVCVVIDVSILHVFFKRHSSNYAFSFLIFIALYLGAELDILRNMKSIGLFLLSVKYIQQRRFLPYLLLMTLAFMFHSSTLFLFPLYFVPRTLPRQCFIVVFVVGNLLYLSQIAYMAPLISEGGRLLGENTRR